MVIHRVRLWPRRAALRWVIARQRAAGGPDAGCSGPHPARTALKFCVFGCELAENLRSVPRFAAFMCVTLEEASNAHGNLSWRLGSNESDLVRRPYCGQPSCRPTEVRKPRMSTTMAETNAAARPARTPHPRSILMCKPEFFTVVYRINPWMDPELPTDTSLAVSQWEELRAVYTGLGFDVQLVDPVDGLPDMVYAANGGTVIDGIAYGAKFTYPQRQAEGPAYMDWFGANGFTVAVPEEVNEGEGDLLLVGDVVLAGTGFRTATKSHRELAKVLGREVVTLTLINPSFYHLDTALAVLDSTPGQEHIAYLPSAFDEASLAYLREHYPNAIIVTEEDAAILGLNSFSDGFNVVIAKRAADFERQLREHGYNPIGVDLSELLLGGGGVKCCTLELRK